MKSVGGWDGSQKDYCTEILRRFHNYRLCRTVHNVTLEHETRWHTNLPPGLFLIYLFLSSNSFIGNGHRFFQLSLSGARPSVVGSSLPLHAICVTFPQILIPAHAKGTLSEGDIAPPLSKRRARPTVLELSWVKGAVGDPSTGAQLEWCHLLWRPPWFRPSGCFHPLASCHLARVSSACSKLVSASPFQVGCSRSGGLSSPQMHSKEPGPRLFVLHGLSSFFSHGHAPSELGQIGKVWLLPGKICVQVLSKW